MNRFRFILASVLLMVPLRAAFADQDAVVIQPAADVWSEPFKGTAIWPDDKRETQVLFGEQVTAIETKGAWVRIEAVEQPEFTHHKKWEGYPGWVKLSALQMGTPAKETVAIVLSSWTSITEPESAPDLWLPLGTFVRPTGKTDQWYVVPTPLGDRCLVIDKTRARTASKWNVRNTIIATAESFLGVPYLWGGMTAGKPPPQALGDGTMKFGVDCSGLVHASYRVNGVQIPRDSHEQWMKATRIKRNDLMPADLIFSAAADAPKKIIHVALYTGGNQIIEAPQSGLVVRKISFKEKYGKPLAAVESGTKVGNRVIYFGRLLND